MLLALVCPPLLCLATVILIFVVLENLESQLSFRDFPQELLILSVPGAVLISTVILLDLRAGGRFSALAAADVRAMLCMSALVSLLFLSVWVTAQTARDSPSDVGAIIMFICLPTLMLCAPLLWYSTRAIRRTSLRVGLLAGFVIATAWAEWQCPTADGGGIEEHALMFHSMLVALAVAISLCVWGATDFRTTEGVGR